MGTYSKIKQVCLFVIVFGSWAQNDVTWIAAQKGRIASRGGVCSMKLPLEKKKVESRNAAIEQGTSWSFRSPSPPLI